ncbi:MAG: hypothetical protein IJJ00_04820 [Erysipelotrichaceae bacterium]|nr:hypothetical protein [Erysipelotrichaceae bacterium]
MNFYLDDYDRITVLKNERLLNGNLRVFVNNEDVSYDLENDEEHLFVVMDHEYEDRDVIRIVLHDEEYEVLPRFITHTERFDEEYKTDVYGLGSFIDDDHTLFRLWAPLSKSAYLVYEGQEKEMSYLGKGLYEIRAEGRLDGRTYHYKVLREKAYEFTDPFSYIDKDRRDSYVIDKRKLYSERIVPKPYSSVSIYETSVRDFSSDKNVPFEHPKKFLGLIEEGLTLDGEPAGFDYLVGLGISHVQLLPVFSFDLDRTEYNWGYNPTTFNSLERSYLVSEDPYEQLKEFRSVVDHFHRNDLRINLDVVYNHVFRQGDFPLEKMLPFYFFRYDGDKVGNASFCGNETRSEGLFFREYLKLITGRFIEIFDIDGLRFDIMGILDKRTMKEIYEHCKELKDDFIVYGEGWNMGDLLPYEERAIIENGRDLKHIGFFLDGFRNTMRGYKFSDEDAYLLGAVDKRSDVKRVINGSHYLGLEDDQALNYIECHDNYTFFDKVHKFFKKEEDQIRICKLGLAVVILSRGIPFLHSGQEFLRTKKDIDNSYNCPDEINMLDWKRKNRYLEVSRYCHDLLSLRNSIDLFYREDVRIEFEQYYEVLIYKLDNLRVFINPCVFDHIYADGNEYEIIFDGNGFNNYVHDGVDIPAFSVVVGYIR